MVESKVYSQVSPPDFFVLRTPLLSFDELLSWSASAGTLSSPDSSKTMQEWIDASRVLLRSYLKSVVERDVIREALFIASPDLEESIDRWLRDPESKSAQRTERALVRYFVRMAGRATPFGLFSGCSLGSIGRHTCLAISALAHNRRHTRLDMDYLYSLTELLEREPALRRELRYRPNSSLYRAAGQIRYVESRLQNDVRSYHLVAVEPSPYLESTLNLATTEIQRSDLATSLVDADAEVSLTDAEEYIDELIDSQILVSDLSPTVTGDEALNTLASKLRTVPGNAKTAETLVHLQSELNVLDASGLGRSPQQYRAIARPLEDLPGRVNLARLFQVDMFKPAPFATLGSEPIKEITNGVEILRRLTPSPKQDPLQEFRSAFIERYGEGREVSLIEALDEEFGVGFSVSGSEISDTAPLLEGIAFPNRAPTRNFSLGRGKAYLLQMLGTALTLGKQEISLDENDLEELASENPPPLPDAFAVMATLAATSESALQKGDFQVVINSIGGPPGARLLGRFCYADEALRARVENHLRAEERLEPDVIFAEIVHLPEGRLGNILSRPVMRGYEIPYMGRAGAPAERQLPITDLLVSVIRDRVILRSIKFQREVHPRLTTAHNFSRYSLGIYRFLCTLQAQGVASGLGWDWGDLAGASFLPRVRSGRVVLSKARWNITKKELQLLTTTKKAEQFEVAHAWSSGRKLPRFAMLADADNELPIDFHNVLSVETFLELIKARDAASLVEMYPSPEQLCAHGPEGRFVHELILPFVTNRSPTRRVRTSLATARPTQRIFPPGTEWAYVKLYGGSSTADRVLCNLIRPITDDALRANVADRWFFIRYGDPERHLRLRLHGQADRLNSEVLPAIYAKATSMTHAGQLWRVEVATYVRELERYGGTGGIDLAERMFHADSEAVLSIIETLYGDEGAKARSHLAMCGIDMLLDDFKVDIHLKLAMLEKMKESFAREFKLDVNLKRQFGEKYRRERKEIEDVLDQIRDGNRGNMLDPGLSALRRRSSDLMPTIAEFGIRENKGLLSLSSDDIIPSLIHMHVNRLLRSAHREQELVLYDFLARNYESRTHRERIGRARSVSETS